MPSAPRGSLRSSLGGSLGGSPGGASGTLALAGAVGVAVAGTLAFAGTGLVPMLCGAAAGAVAVVLVSALAGRDRPSPAGRGQANVRWTALLESGGERNRETLAAVERLTDPLAIEHTITKAMRNLEGIERLELQRAPDAPSGALTQASLAEPVLLQAAIGPGVLRRSTMIVPDAAAAMEKLGADVVVVVRYDARVYGLLVVEGRPRGAQLLQLQRFADLLAFKLEIHRVYGELAHREQLAALGKFASAIAHDLRSPLSSISLSVNALKERREELGDDAELLDVAAEQTQRLTNWLNELVDASRPVRVKPRSLDVSEIVSAVARRHESAAVEASIRLCVEMAPDLPRVSGDAGPLERALDNLVRNAISVAPRGSDVRIEARVVPGRVRIDVVDRGPGIPPADRERIFEPFFTSRQGGTGLGLDSARRIVEAHGGSLEVDSAVGRGTRMVVLLPHDAAARERSGA